MMCSHFVIPVWVSGAAGSKSEYIHHPGTFPLSPGEVVQAWQYIADGPKVANEAQCCLLERSQ
eukprot:1143834-Pelagomonas_calceolata.AAC.1